MAPHRRLPVVAVVLLLLLVLLLQQPAAVARTTPRVRRHDDRQPRKPRASQPRFVVEAPNGAPTRAGPAAVHGGADEPLLPKDQTSLLVIGATGGLGRQVVRDALAGGEHAVSGIVRSLAKAHTVFTRDEMRRMHLFEGAVGGANETEDLEFLKMVMEQTQAQVVVEVRAWLLGWVVFPSVGSRSCKDYHSSATTLCAIAMVVGPTSLDVQLLRVALNG
jgi:hypothetical protein